MKRKIISSTYVDLDAYASLDTAAFNAGYRMKVSNEGDISMWAESDPKYMPKILVDTIRSDDGTLRYYAKIKFPTLNTNDMEWYDEVAYYIDQWKSVGKFIALLTKFCYDPSEYID